MCENVQPRSGIIERSISLRLLIFHLAISFLSVLVQFALLMFRHGSCRTYLWSWANEESTFSVIEKKLSGFNLDLNGRKPISLEHADYLLSFDNETKIHRPQKYYTHQSCIKSVLSTDLRLVKIYNKFILMISIVAAYWKHAIHCKKSFSTADDYYPLLTSSRRCSGCYNFPQVDRYSCCGNYRCYRFRLIVLMVC